MIYQHYGDPLKRYSTVNSLIMQTYEQNCLDISYNKFINDLKNTSWNSSASVGGRQWTYQTCIEFGFFQSTDSPKQPFGPTIPAQFYIQQCQEIFEDAFDINFLKESVYNTNINYGGYNYEASRVVFVNGEVDPWHALGFTGKPPNDQTETVFIHGTAHCADMYPGRDEDPQELKDARIKIGNLLQKWLQVD